MIPDKYKPYLTWSRSTRLNLIAVLLYVDQFYMVDQSSMIMLVLFRVSLGGALFSEVMVAHLEYQIHRLKQQLRDLDNDDDNDDSTK